MSRKTAPPAPPTEVDDGDALNRMWGGRFSSSPDAVMEAINASVDFDRRLYAEDIEGSIAHVTMLAKQGIVTQEDAGAIVDGLDRVRAEIEAGGFPFDRGLEDIHMNVEARLAALIGPAAGRLHTARSRNDQVATDLRLWLRASLDRADEACRGLQAAFVDRAEEHAATVMPGFTHLQVAQPVSLGHHLLAYVEMIGRDRGRLADCRRRLNESPLGAAALAGTSYSIDRAMTAEQLGFDRPAANSIDAVSDRDFVIEALAAAALIATHLSRLAEELVLWSSAQFGFITLSDRFSTGSSIMPQKRNPDAAELVRGKSGRIVGALIATHLSRLAEELVLWSSAQFGFITLSDRFSTGSSIMPQKRNPDAAELVRGKSGRIVGALIALLTVMKGLALTYSKDMQEDKEPLFDAFDSLELCLAAATGMVRDMTVHEGAMARAAGTGHATATDLADWLVQEAGLPFREAHAITGRVVKHADESGCDLKDLALADLQAIEPRITADALALLDPAQAIARRTSEGGTAPGEVEKQIARARQRFL